MVITEVSDIESKLEQALNKALALDRDKKLRAIQCYLNIQREIAELKDIFK
jgi:hypothetical protein